MPEPPNVALFTRYVFENPYPLGIALVLFGVIVGWLAYREGRMGRLRAAAAAVLLGAAVLTTGSAVVTSGEHARTVTRQLITAVVKEDLVNATNLLADQARMHFGSSRNVAWNLQYITTSLSRLAQYYQIEDNKITKLKGYTETRDAATVHVACWTDAGYGYTPSQWVLEIRRQADGQWKVTRLTCISVNGRPPQTPPW